jgi:hypothetical protein
MKKYLIILLLANCMWACNSEQRAGNKESVNASEMEHHQDSTEKLELNNGVKWKADSITNKNVRSLKSIVENFNNGPDKTIPATKKVAGDLQQGLDRMISECKMQGPDHTALHKWLEPLIAGVSKLKQVSTETEAARTIEAIHTQLNLYNQYFE